MKRPEAVRMIALVVVLLALVVPRRRRCPCRWSKPAPKPVHLSGDVCRGCIVSGQLGDLLPVRRSSRLAHPVPRRVQPVSSVQDG